MIIMEIQLRTWNQPSNGPFHADINKVFPCVRNHDVVNGILNFAADNEMTQVLVHVLSQEGGEWRENPDHGIEDGEKCILESNTCITSHQDKLIITLQKTVIWVSDSRLTSLLVNSPKLDENRPGLLIRPLDAYGWCGRTSWWGCRWTSSAWNGKIFKLSLTSGTDVFESK